MSDQLRDDEAGALQVGPTDLGMVRFIIQTPHGLVEMDFEPDEAADIADELLASADIARKAGGAKRSGARTAAPQPGQEQPQQRGRRRAPDASDGRNRGKPNR